MITPGVFNDRPNLDWLLNHPEPSVRFLVRRDLLHHPPADPELQSLAQLAHTTGPIAKILKPIHPDGCWVKPGAGYSPKYTGTVWSLINLAQLGASIQYDARIGGACEHLIRHSLVPGGQFTFNGTPSSTADCLQGNLCAALLDLGVDPERLVEAFNWMACTVTGEGIAPSTDRNAPRRYYAGKCGPSFACGSNNKLPCAWGGVKVMLALGKLPAAFRTPEIERAILAGIEFFLAVDPLTADYPHGYADKPSGNWWKLGFPVFYVSDLLQIIEALARLGCGGDPRLSNSIRWLISRADEAGRWSLEYDYAGKTWVSFGVKKQPNPWVTLRALTALNLSGVFDLTSAGG